MFERGRRLFTTGSILLVLVAAMHTIGHFASSPQAEDDAAAEAAMRSADLDMGMGMAPTIMDIFAALSLTMPIMLVIWAALNLIVASGDPSGRLVGRSAWAGAAGAAALAALYAWARIPPPLISFCVVAAVFLASAVTNRNR